jgi:Ni,Fe-hydrogenase III small subunit
MPQTASALIVSGALGRNTRKKTEKALDAADRLDLAAVTGRVSVAAAIAIVAAVVLALIG